MYDGKRQNRCFNLETFFIESGTFLLHFRLFCAYTTEVYMLRLILFC